MTRSKIRNVILIHVYIDRYLSMITVSLAVLSYADVTGTTGLSIAPPVLSYGDISLPIAPSLELCVANCVCVCGPA